MLIQFYRSTVGKKIIMALTGFIFVGFVIAHMVGNLKIFAGINPLTGVHKFDEYAVFLREMGAHVVGHETVLWIARAVLLISIILHMLMAFQLAALNRKAKPVGTYRPNYRSSNAASRTMLFGGLVILVFVVYHILHFTTGTVHFNGFIEGKVYSNVYLGFQNKLIAGFYVFAMGCLALHLYHGTWSLFQTLGIDNPAWNNGLRSAAKIISILVFIGFISLPISVSLGLLKGL